MTLNCITSVCTCRKEKVNRQSLDKKAFPKGDKEGIYNLFPKQYTFLLAWGPSGQPSIRGVGRAISSKTPQFCIYFKVELTGFTVWVGQHDKEQ